MFFIFFTIISVSIDAFIYGLTLPKDGRKRLVCILVQALIVLSMCLVTCLLGKVIGKYIPERYASLCGIIFIITGIENLIELILTKDKNQTQSDNGILKTVVVGFIIGVDSAAANFSFALSGITSLIYPFLFALTHAVLGYAGSVVMKNKSNKGVKGIYYVFPIFLILHGLINLISFFI